MRNFKDTKGRDWVLHVDVGALKRVRDLTNVDLWNFEKESARLFGDPILLSQVLYALCRDQCLKRTITDGDGNQRTMIEEDFWGGMDGDTLYAAANTLTDAVVDSFHESRRTAMRALLTKREEVEQKIKAKAMTQIEKLTADQLIQAMESVLATNSPAS